MDIYQYNQYLSAQQSAVSNKEKSEELKNRMKEFMSVVTLEDAKKLASKIVPTSQEITVFYSGDAKCTVVNRADLLRITLETKEDYICYDFT